MAEPGPGSKRLTLEAPSRGRRPARLSASQPRLDWRGNGRALGDDATLWLYSEEDGYYSAAWIRRYHEAFAQAGGVATFRLFPAFGANGHRLVDRVEIWKAAADDFLRRLNLVSR